MHKTAYKNKRCPTCYFLLPDGAIDPVVQQGTCCPKKQHQLICGWSTLVCRPTISKLIKTSHQKDFFHSNFTVVNSFVWRNFPRSTFYSVVGVLIPKLQAWSPPPLSAYFGLWWWWCNVFQTVLKRFAFQSVVSMLWTSSSSPFNKEFMKLFFFF